MQKKQKIKHNGKITIDKLASMVADGFDGLENKINRGFADVNARFTQIDERFDRIEIKLENLERRIFSIENILTEYGRDIREMKNILTEHGKDLKEIKAELIKLKESDRGNSDKIFELEQRVKVLEVKV